MFHGQRGKCNYRANKSKLKEPAKLWWCLVVPQLLLVLVASVAQSEREVIESSLYQIMTGAILSVLAQRTLRADEIK